jgi:hypothetical protein
MTRGIIAAIMALSLVFAVGCEEISGLTQGMDTSSRAGPEIVRSAELGPEWQMKQMNLEVEADGELSILLKLADGDMVDGYFYLEKGDEIAFQITGDSLVYESKGQDGKDPDMVASNRFSFIASQAQGTTYTMTFRNTDEASKVSLFLEVIYPVDGSIFIPVENS